MSFFRAGIVALMERQAWLAAAAAAALAAYVVVRGGRRYGHWSAKARFRLRAAFAAVLLVGVVYGGVSYFYSARYQGWVHRWDLFHTVTSVRFFDELGHTRLYECALVIDQGHKRRFRVRGRIRDLKTLRYVDATRAMATSDCGQRFSDERRRQFEGDLDFWWQLRPSWQRWLQLFQDKGYNGTPFYSALIALAVGDRPLSLGTIEALTMVDVLLVCAALGFVAWGYGPVVGAFAALFFFVNFPGRFVHMGGSILRFDYVAYLIIGLCLLKRNRYGWAGALFALSAMARGFPIVFALAVAVKAAWESLAARHVARRYRWFFGVFAATACACFLFSLTFDGLDGWRAFADNIRLHTARSAGFRIGFPHMFMLDGNLTGDHGFIPYWDKARLFGGRKPFYWLSVVALVAPMVLLARRMTDVAFASLAGLLFFFAAMVATRYYYTVLVVVFLAGYDLRRERFYAPFLLASFALSIAGHILMIKRVYVSLIYNVIYTGSLLAFFVLLTAALAWHHGALRWPRRWRDLPEPRGETTEQPASSESS